MIAIRTCAGCGERASQRDLVRVVIEADELRPDRSRRAGGRGAYLHERPACWSAFVTRRGPVRSLRAAVSRAARERLVAVLERGATGGVE